MSPEPLTTLRTRLGELSDIQAAARLLEWDEQTMMPEGGQEARAHQMGTLERIAHERFVSDDVGELLEQLSSRMDLDATDDDSSLVRVAARRYRKARQVPADLKFEIAYSASAGQHEWQAARAADNLSDALPALRRNVELARRYAACFDEGDDPYDHLLDDYEEGMPTADVATLFDSLKRDLIGLARAISERGDTGIEPLEGPFDLDRQRTFVRELLGRVGFDERIWRVDEAAHPFLAPVARTDLRLTTRYIPETLDGALAALHEFGHGLYSGGVAASLERTPLGTSASMGLDESQSRLWENVIGRSRPFATFLCPLVQRHFPEALGDADPDRVYRGFNVVKPTLIRVSSDEVNYSLHVILRFEIERELIAGDLDVADVGERWNELVAEYLGAEVTSDAVGVLQDVHWWAGLFGYFPTYALGNVMSLQVWERLTQELPSVEDDIAAGRFEPLREWLTDRIYRHGAKLTSTQLLENLTGGGLEATPYLRYLRTKFGALYGLETSASSARA
ncbi:MAG: carboxypeptidase Taq [Solirubrobacteraceae bacterium]|nr:carboxypeptidase Taq [Solirubrobacteraceae bacterium]